MTTLAGRPLGYPWETSTGELRWPTHDLAIATRLGDPASNLATRTLDFATKVERNFEAIFP